MEKELETAIGGAEKTGVDDLWGVFRGAKPQPQNAANV